MIDIKITDLPLNPQACLDFVKDPAAGASNSFVGRVRNRTKNKTVLRLEFEAYEKMALKEMRKIAEAAIAKWPVTKIAFHHRTGVLNINEIAVVICLSTPHRKEGFEACQFCIDTLKETVPIWKKEIFEDGEVWVSATP